MPKHEVSRNMADRRPFEYETWTHKICNNRSGGSINQIQVNFREVNGKVSFDYSEFAVCRLVHWCAHSIRYRRAPANRCGTKSENTNNSPTVKTRISSNPSPSWPLSSSPSMIRSIGDSCACVHWLRTHNVGLGSNQIKGIQLECRCLQCIHRIHFSRQNSTRWNPSKQIFGSWFNQRELDDWIII